MNYNRLEEIKLKENLASQGPWEVDKWNNYITNEGGSIDIVSVCDGTLWIYEGDANFIASAREDIPYLVSEVERLKKALERITEHRVNKFITKDKMVDSMFNIAKEALKEAK